MGLAENQALELKDSTEVSAEDAAERFLVPGSAKSGVAEVEMEEVGEVAQTGEDDLGVVADRVLCEVDVSDLVGG